MATRPEHSRRTIALARGRGFTLIELVVAGVIMAIIGSATTAVIANFARVKTRSADRQQAYSRAEAVAAAFEQDALAVVRDSDLTVGRVQVIDGGSQAVPNDSVLLIVRTLRRVRGIEGSPEGGDFEVQYKIDSNPATRGLWRRMDPALDDAQDAGGVATLLAGNPISLSVQAYDGENWFDAWDSDSDGFPHALRLSVTVASDDGIAAATSIRTVAIDRVPLPPETKDSTSTGSSNSSGSSSSSSGAGSGGGSP